MIEIVKPQLDLGLLTRSGEVVDFWRVEVGLRLDHVLPVGPGHDQHRFDFEGSVIKVNLLPALPVTRRSGFEELLLARSAVASPIALSDPDGNRLRIVPPGHEGVTQIGVRLRVPDRGRSMSHYRDVLGWVEEAPDRLRCGDSVILIEETVEAPTGVELPVLGWAYLTVQVRDCDAEVARIEAAGARVQSRPRNLGEVARMAMVGDPDGNSLEISQRASLTGSLPRGDS